MSVRWPRGRGILGKHPPIVAWSLIAPDAAGSRALETVATSLLQSVGGGSDGGVLDIAQFNRNWLAAWSDKDVPRLLQFYSGDASYKDPNVPAGVRGHSALGVYLTKLFANTPPMRYEPDTVWAIDGGFCGRWYCTIELGAGKRSMLRGFDFVALDGDRIVQNEVYTHTMPGTES